MSACPKIEAWLDTISATDTNNIHSPLPPTKKRCRDEPATTSTAPRKAPRRRRVLASMDGNSNAKRRSPRKKDSDATRGNEHQDVSKTPRPGVRAAHCTTSAADARPPPPVFGQQFVRDVTILSPSGTSQTNQAEYPSPTRSSSSYAASSASSIATSIMSSNTAGSRRREKSPVKNPSDLLFAERPVRFDPPVAFRLPAHVKDLDSKLKAAKAGINVVPQAMEHRIALSAADSNEAIHDWNIDRLCDLPRQQLEREFDELTEICQATADAKRMSASESSWNDEVHSRLFRAAFRLQPGVRHHNVTSARPCKDFLPKHLASGAIMESKLVDYTINLEPISGSTFEKRILHLLNSQPEPRQCITQTLYNPVRLKPAAFSVETKSGQGKDDDAKMQLGIWVGAHFRRLRSLLYARHGEKARDIPLPAHPLVIVNVNVLAVMYAIEQDDEVWIMPGPQLDVPSTVFEGYKCLAALRSLAAWADGDFRRWVENVLLPPV